MLIPLGFLCLAILFFVLELLLPSMGILTVAGVGSCLAWIITAFVYGGVGGGIGAIFVTAFVGVFLFEFATRWWPETKVGKAMLIGEPARSHLAGSPHAERRVALIGRSGHTLSPMLPSGAVEIDGQSYDAITDGMALERGVEIVVVSLVGNSLIVAPRPAAPASPNPTPTENTTWVPDPFDDSLG